MRCAVFFEKFNGAGKRHEGISGSRTKEWVATEAKQGHELLLDTDEHRWLRFLN